MNGSRAPPSSSCSVGGASPLVADEPVGVVLEHVEPALGHQLRESAPALGAERAPARVLERRDRVEKGDVAAAIELGLERAEVETLVVHRQRNDLGAREAQELQRPVIGRALDRHAPAGARAGRRRSGRNPAALGQKTRPGAGSHAARPELAERAVAPTRGFVGRESVRRPSRSSAT